MTRKLILSIDGGGVKGAFAVRVLSLIEKHTGKRIRDLFDLVVGVSVGAAIASVVAHQDYDDLMALIDVYGVPHFNKQPGGPVFKTMYDGKAKTKRLKEQFGDVKIRDVKHPLVILAARIDGTPVLYSSWDDEHGDVSVASIVDASTAVPVYFPPVEIDTEHYIDGGVVSSDPVLAGIMMAKSKWGTDVEICAMSLGPSTSAVKGIYMNDPTEFGLLRWVKEGLIDLLSRSNTKLYEEIIPIILGPGRYMRINSSVEGYLDDMSENMLSLLLADANIVFETYGESIVKWVASNDTSNSSENGTP